MNRPRLLVVGLDGFDPDVARQLMDQGLLPHLHRHLPAAHRMQLEHGVARYTGLAWEQFSSGLAPEASQRWSSHVIDAAAYTAEQPCTRLRPFTADVGARTVVFDVPYFDLAQSPGTQGLVSWGAHDPGVAGFSRPDAIAAEAAARFGPYPATEFIYGHVWPNAARTRTMGQRLVAALRLRSEVTRWLLAERLPEWDLALTVISEYHSATEALWHGWDEGHPLHRLPSAGPAREGLVAVYAAADALLGELRSTFPDARMLAFTPHGMGRNQSDVACMLLLPELLYRHATGRPGFTPDPAWALDGTGSPDLEQVPHWSNVVNGHVSVTVGPREERRQRAAGQGLARTSGLDWMPAARYRAAWPRMRAYALPTYYDGRVRVNLKGREARGVVPVRHYRRTLDEVCALISACRDPRTGQPPPLEFERREEGDPRRRDPSDADLLVRFHSDVYALEHPTLGRIGPAPCRRTGGHTGGDGAAYYWNGAASGRDLGRFRTLDVARAVTELAGDRGAGGALGAALSAAR